MKNVPGTTNISFNKRDNVYTICKSINGKNKFFGEYPTLIIALMVKDYLESKNWGIKPEEKSLNTNAKYYTYSKDKKLYEVRKFINGQFYSFGYYKTEEEAKFIVEGLKKANWNVDNLTGEYFKFYKDKTDNDLKYIYKKKYDYSIDKNINGETVHFFSNPSLEICKKVRDLLVATDWDMNMVPQKQTATNEPYIYRPSHGEGFYIAKNINGKQVYFDFCRTLKQAKKERDLLIKYNWDIDLLCENEDEINEFGEMWLNGKLNHGNIYYRPLNGRIDYDKNIFINMDG